MMRSKKTKYIITVLIVAWWSLVGYASFNRPSAADIGLSIAAVADSGTVSKPASVLTRDGGAAGLVGGQLLWSFGDTLYKTTDGYTAQPADWRSATAGLASTTNPVNLNETVGAHGIPQQFLPYTAEELAYNQKSGNANERYAVWPTAIVPLNNDTSLVFYTSLKVHPGFLNYEILGTGTARVSAGQTVAQRNPGLLFTGTDQNYNRGMVDGSTLYLYNCTVDKTTLLNPCKVAKVPLSQAENKSAYLAWDGNSWGSLDSAKSVLDGSTSGFSVYWNPTIGRFVAVYMPAFTNTVYYRVAVHPEGPWSDQQVLFKAQAPPAGVKQSDYAATVHPELSADGLAIFVSYYRPTGDYAGDLVLTKVQLNMISAPLVASGSGAGSTANSKAGGSSSGAASASGSTAVPSTTPAVKSSAIESLVAGNPILSHHFWLVAGTVTVGIIGAGLAGDYTLWQLRKRHELARHFPHDYDVHGSQSG